MPIITGRQNVLDIYAKAAERGWVIPCICSENLTSTEAIIKAASDFAKDNGFKSVPVTLAMTIKYPNRPQAAYYTHTRDTDIGLKLFRADAEIISEAYPNVDLMLHLDHAQYDLDEKLLESDLSIYSTVMYDASALPLEENITKTREFVKKQGANIVIEGACDEIVDATGDEHNDITTPEKCEDYFRRTGVDLVVANLGTEHRASGKDLKYHADAARAIRDRVGAKIVLHGTSSVSSDQIVNLFSDGICKVNIWTAIERDSSPALTEFMVKNAAKAGGPAIEEKLYNEGLLAKKTGDKASLAHYTTTARQEIVYNEMLKIIRAYFDMWYVL